MAEIYMNGDTNLATSTGSKTDPVIIDEDNNIQGDAGLIKTIKKEKVDLPDMEVNASHDLNDSGINGSCEINDINELTNDVDELTNDIDELYSSTVHDASVMPRNDSNENLDSSSSPILSVNDNVSEIKINESESNSISHEEHSLEDIKTDDKTEKVTDTSEMDTCSGKGITSDVVPCAVDLSLSSTTNAVVNTDSITKEIDDVESLAANVTESFVKSVDDVSLTESYVKISLGNDNLDKDVNTESTDIPEILTPTAHSKDVTPEEMVVSADDLPQVSDSKIEDHNVLVDADVSAQPDVNVQQNSSIPNVAINGTLVYEIPDDSNISPEPTHDEETDDTKPLDLTESVVIVENVSTTEASPVGNTTIDVPVIDLTLGDDDATPAPTIPVIEITSDEKIDEEPIQIEMVNDVASSPEVVGETKHVNVEVIEDISATVENTVESEPVPVDSADVTEAAVADVTKAVVADVAKSADADVTKSADADVAKSADADVAKTAVADVAKTAVADVAKTADADVVKSANADVAKTADADVAKSAVADVAKTAVADVAKSADADVAKTADADVAKSADVDVAKTADADVTKSSDADVAKSADADVAKIADADVAKSAVAYVAEAVVADVTESTTAEDTKAEDTKAEDTKAVPVVAINETKSAPAEVSDESKSTPVENIGKSKSESESIAVESTDDSSYNPVGTVEDLPSVSTDSVKEAKPAPDVTAKVDTAKAEKTGEEKVPPEEEWMDILGNGLLRKKVILRGNGQDTRPVSGNIVTVRCEGRLTNGMVVDKHNKLQFVLSDEDVIQAFDLAIALMEDKEVATVFTDARYAYGIHGRPDFVPPIPQNASITYEIEVLSVEESPELEMMTSEERIMFGDKKRVRGNELYGKEEYAASINAYKRGIKYLEGTDNEDVMNMKVKCLNNLSAAQLKVKAYKMAIQSLDTVLEFEPENVKALFRKGKCLDGLKKEEEALEYIKKASILDPQNKSITQELGRLKSRVAVTHQKEKEIYQKMFQAKKEEKISKEEEDLNWSVRLTTAVVGVLGIIAGILWYKHR